MLKINLVILILGNMLLSACATSPAQESSTTDSKSVESSKQQRMDELFQQAKSLFEQQQYGQAAQILLPLAQQGHLDAQYTIGYLYHYGLGVPRNEKEATRWITTAAARGHVKAEEALKLLDDYYGRPTHNP